MPTDTIPASQTSSSPEEKPAPKYVVTYESSPQARDLAPVHFPAHSAHCDDFRARGDLLLVGTFADPMTDGSMAVFRSRAAAEEFIEGDPFRTEGVISGWTIKEWHEAYMR